MYYHASATGGIQYLKPQISNHKIPLVYFSLKRENALIYLSNAVERKTAAIPLALDGGLR